MIVGGLVVDFLQLVLEDLGPNVGCQLFSLVQQNDLGFGQLWAKLLCLNTAAIDH